MEQIHGHEVLDMMEGKTFSEQSLENAIIEKFGKDQRFFTCSAQNLTAKELIQFLKERGKFKPENDGFTVNSQNRCNHEE